jgi:hypothetical protein
LPSTKSWAQVLSNKFNVPVLNLSQNGGSISLMLHTIRNHNWQVGDIALIQWTYFKRTTIFDNETARRHLLLANIDSKDAPYTKQYYMLFPDYHIEYTNLQHIEHAYLYLASHNIPTVARFTHDAIHSVSLSGFDHVMLADFKKPTLDDVAERLREKDGSELLGADKMHYNSLVHEKFAEEYVSEITNLL